MRIAFIALALIAAAPLAQAEANGEHPAIVARRVIAAQGYDYASAFYRHPAGLNLAAEAPRSMQDLAPAGTTERAAVRRTAALRAASRK